MPDEAKPITNDPDEQELLKSMDIPLTDPNAKKDEDETVAAPAKEEEKVDEPETPETQEAETPTEPAADVPDDAGGGAGDEPGDVAAGGGSDGDRDVPGSVPASTGADGGVKAPPAKPPAPAPDPLAEELDALTKTIKADDFDPYSTEGKDALLRRQDLAAELSARRVHQSVTAESRFWANIVETYGVPEPRARALYAEEATRLTAEYPGTDIQIAATEAWKARLAAIKNGGKGPEAKAAKEESTPAKKPLAKTPITPAGAKVSPPGKVSVPPPPRPKTDEEELVDTLRKTVPGGIRSMAR